MKRLFSSWYRILKCVVILCCLLVLISLILENVTLDLEDGGIPYLKDGWSYEDMSPPTMKTIVAYSAEKRAEMERKYPISCGNTSSLPEVNLNTSRWQSVAGSDVLLYAGYYDDRISGRPYVRILSMVKGRKLDMKSPLFCQTRFSTEVKTTIESVEVTPSEIWWDGWDKFSFDVETPLLFSCPLASLMNETFHVSVVLNPCQTPSNSLRIEPVSTNYSKINFTLCVKDMFFDTDISSKLVEWIEFNRIVGANMIDIYVDSVHEEIRRVLYFYQQSNVVRILSAPIPSGNRSLWQRRRDHLITYNDCLYRNMHYSKYIVPIDVDEVIVPRKSSTWGEVIDNVLGNDWDSERFAALTVRNAFFFDNINDESATHKVNDSTEKNYDRLNGFSRNKCTKLDIENIIYYMPVSNSSEIICVHNSKSNKEANDIKSDALSKKVTINIDNNGNTTKTSVLQKNRIENTAKRKTNDSVTFPVPVMLRHLIRSALVSPMADYGKSFVSTSYALTVFNHYPLAILDVGSRWRKIVPLSEAQLNHYKEKCQPHLVPECAVYLHRRVQDDIALKFSRQLVEAIRVSTADLTNF